MEEFKKGELYWTKDKVYLSILKFRFKKKYESLSSIYFQNVFTGEKFDVIEGSAYQEDCYPVKGHEREVLARVFTRDMGEDAL